MWLGVFIGSLIGSRFGALGTIAGVLLGFWAEFTWRKNRAIARARRASQQRARVVRAKNSRAYTILGVSSSATNDQIRDAYRQKAKMFHPDMMRARGASEEKIREATKQMARINDAWQEIRERRGI